MSPSATAFDLDGYLERVGYTGPRQPTLDVLRAVHEAHLAHIPFENIDVRLGRSIRLDLAALQDKLVRRGRGGYCFEHNLLFAAALAALGFRVETLEARVRPPGATTVLPRTHMVLRVDLDGQAWLADVGFGGDGSLRPVALDGRESAEAGAHYRVGREGAVHVLQTLHAADWRDLYAFSLQPALPADYEVANHYTSTHPESRFVTTLTVQHATAERRRALRGRIYTERAGGVEHTRELSVEDVVRFVVLDLGLGVSDDEVRRALGGEGRDGPGHAP